MCLASQAPAARRRGCGPRTASVASRRRLRKANHRSSRTRYRCRRGQQSRASAGPAGLRQRQRRLDSVLGWRQTAARQNNIMWRGLLGKSWRGLPRSHRGGRDHSQWLPLTKLAPISCKSSASARSCACGSEAPDGSTCSCRFRPRSRTGLPLSRSWLPAASTVRIPKVAVTPSSAAAECGPSACACPPAAGPSKSSTVSECRCGVAALHSRRPGTFRLGS